MGSDAVVIFKEIKSRKIQTFVNLDGHGVAADIETFIGLVADAYGSPFTTLTRKGLLAGLLAASDRVILQMKEQTREVAAVNLEPKADTAVTK